MNRFLMLIAIFLVFMACNEDPDYAKISVKNNVSNTTLSQVNYSGHNFYASLIPGQSSSVTIEGYKEDWPRTGRISFIMSANGKQVYLLTKASYTLNPDDDLLVVISDTTQVENP